MKHIIVPKVRWLSAALLVAGMSTLFASQAQAVTLINPSFEDIIGEAPFNEFTFGPLTGWDLYDPGNITDGGDGPTYYIGTLTPNPPTNFTDGASDGQRVGIAFNFFGSGGQGEYGMQQVSNESLLPNTTYRLSVDVGNIASGVAVSGENFDLEGFPGYRIELFAGGVMVAEDDNTLAGLIPEGEFMTSVREFTTGASPGAGYVLRLINLNEIDPLYPDANLEVDFDNVILEEIVPLFCSCDLNGDGFVGIDDLNIVLSNWNQNVPPGDPLADPSGDGFVGIDDLNEVLGNWNAGTPPNNSAVPEPGTLATTCLGGLVLLRRR